MRRVSSQATTSAAASASTAGARGRRGCRSACRPAPARRVAPRRSRAAHLQAVAGAHAPPANDPRLGLDARRGPPQHGQPDAVAAQSHGAKHAPVARRRRPRRSGTACRKVCTERAGRSSIAPSMPSRPSRPRRRPGRDSPPRAGQHLVRRAPTRPSTCPSDVEAELHDVAVGDLVVLALEAELADVAGLGPRADLEQLVPVDRPRPG